MDGVNENEKKFKRQINSLSFRYKLLYKYSEPGNIVKSEDLFSKFKDLPKKSNPRMALILFLPKDNISKLSK